MTRRRLSTVGGSSSALSRPSRRNALKGLAGATLFTRSGTAWAQQQPASPVVGFLGIASEARSRQILAAVQQGLQQEGFEPGRTVRIEARWAENQYDRLPELAADLVAQRVDVLVAAGGTASAVAARGATKTIPIVFQVAADPVAAGLVSSLSKPDSNLTGVSNLASELGPKRIELLHDVLPTAKTMAAIANTKNAATANGAIAAIREAARARGLTIEIVDADGKSGFDAALAEAHKRGASGVVMVPDLVFFSQMRELARSALQARMPMAFQFREFAAAGGLMSYGGNITDAFHLVGVYAGRLIKGEKPANLPVQQFTRIELIINLKTAKTLGIDVPPMLLARADEVIE